MHLFFEMGDGNFVAFFDAPADAEESMFEPTGGYDVHVAFECGGTDELAAWQRRIAAAGVPCPDPIDHGFVRSLYMYDPNGLQVEVTARTADHDRIVAEESAEAERVMADWTARSRELKERRFGRERIDARGELCRENLDRIVEQMLAKASAAG